MNNPSQTESKLSQYCSKIITASGFSCGIAIWLTGILIFVQIVARYIFDAQIIFTQEYAGYCVCYIVFIGTCYNLRIKGHVRIDMLEKFLPERPRKWLWVIQALMMVIFSILFLINGVKFVLEAYGSGTISITPLATPLLYPYLVVPIGFLLLTVESLIQFYASISNALRPGHGSAEEGQAGEPAPL
jgi:TRAP-type C4-dicarboxylate transport system permease small subunit